MAEVAAALERDPSDLPAALGRLDAALAPTCARLRAAIAG
jgi:hypothetical protein